MTLSETRAKRYMADLNKKIKLCNKIGYIEGAESYQKLYCYLSNYEEMG